MGSGESTTWFYPVVNAPAERLKVVFGDPRSGETKAGVFNGDQGARPSRLNSEVNLACLFLVVPAPEVETAACQVAIYRVSQRPLSLG